MTGPTALAVVTVAGGVWVGVLISFGEVAAKYRARKAEKALRTAAAVRVPVTAANRAARDSYARLLANTDPVQVARDAERLAPELADLQPWLDRFVVNDRRDVER